MKKLLSSLIVLGLLGLMACETETPANGDRDRNGEDLGGETLATVDGKPVSDRLLAAFVRQYPGFDMDGLQPQQREQLTDHLINLTILSREAERRGIHQEDEIRAAMALERMQTLADALMRKLEEDEPISEDTLREQYEVQYSDSKEYSARHILVEDEDTARDLIAALDEGADFAELAREHSTGPTGERGGDLGWFPAEQMVEPFANAVRAMEAGSFTAEPVQTQFGWHVILLEDTRETEGPAFEEVREQIADNLRQQRVQRYVSELREQAEVER
ncbi:peptidylprolyl isomerase [Natronospira sp.]|uniref:peptidylprolyl isomerase n=1 Tax=Natronospira sp. TaxID=2024970 RepID=UPI003873A4C7